jgi:hypothetical protein
MLEKLFARLRSRRPGSLAVAPAAAPLLSLSTPGSAAGGIHGPTSSTTAGLRALAGPLTPPPLPADAWAESESGIVISDSGIIILEPPSEPRRPSLPSLPPATPPAARRNLTPGELDWDDVLARARARAEVASDPMPPRRPSPRAKVK